MRASLALAAILLAAAHGAAAARAQPSAALRAAPAAPSWPASYSVSYTFSLPFTATIQPDAISYPVDFWRDAAAGAKAARVRMATLNGTNLMVASAAVEYEVVPRLDRQVCRVFRKMEEGEGVAGVSALPDLAGWEFQGEEALLGRAANVWLYQRRHEGKVVRYRFYAAPDGTPLRFYMHGNDALSGAHFGEAPRRPSCRMRCPRAPRLLLWSLLTVCMFCALLLCRRVGGRLLQLRPRPPRRRRL